MKSEKEFKLLWCTFYNYITWTFSLSTTDPQFSLHRTLSLFLSFSPPRPPSPPRCLPARRAWPPPCSTSPRSAPSTSGTPTHPHATRFSSRREAQPRPTCEWDADGRRAERGCRGTWGWCMAEAGRCRPGSPRPLQLWLALAPAASPPPALLPRHIRLALPAARPVGAPRPFRTAG